MGRVAAIALGAGLSVVLAACDRYGIGDDRSAAPSPDTIYDSAGNPLYGSATRPGPGPASPLAPEGCATMMHQDRPGGTDYRGPPVPGCP